LVNFFINWCNSMDFDSWFIVDMLYFYFNYNLGMVLNDVYFFLRFDFIFNDIFIDSNRNFVIFDDYIDGNNFLYKKLWLDRYFCLVSFFLIIFVLFAVWQLFNREYEFVSVFD